MRQKFVMAKDPVIVKFYRLQHTSYARGAADFVVRVLDEDPQASIARNFFEHTLPAQWILHEGRSNEIGGHLRIVESK